MKQAIFLDRDGIINPDEVEKVNKFIIDTLAEDDIEIKDNS